MKKSITTGHWNQTKKPPLDVRARRHREPPLWHAPYALLKPLSQAIRRQIAQLPPSSRVVDFGCGDRPYEPFFTKQGHRYVGCDLVEVVPPVVFEIGKPVPLPAGEAGAVVSFQVLEHVWEIDWYFAEIRRLLRPRGTLLLSTHGTWPYHPCPGDYRRWTGDGLVREIEERGFEVAEVVPILGPLPYLFLTVLLGTDLISRKLGWPGKAMLAVVATVFNVFLPLLDLVTPRSLRAENACVYLVRAVLR